MRTRARSKASTAGVGSGDADGFAAAKGFVDRRRDADATAAQLNTVPSAPHVGLGLGFTMQGTQRMTPCVLDC